MISEKNNGSPETIRILHLEDNDSDAFLVRRLLRKAELPFEYKMVQDKREFVSAFKTYNPDVVLSDHSIPSFSSNDALRIVRQSAHRIPFILLTGTVSEEFAVEMMKEGIEDYILKDRLNRLPNAIVHALERIRAEYSREKYVQEIISRERRFRKLIENSHEAIVLLNEKFETVYRSPSAERITGWDGVRHNNLGFLEDTHPQDAERVRLAILETQNNPGVAVNLAFRVKHQRQIYIWVDVTVRNLLQDEDVEAYVVNYRDVTVSKEAEKELVNKEKHYRALIENISDAIVLVDEKGQVKYHSPSAENVTPWKIEDTEGKTVFDFFHPEDVTRARNFFTQALQMPEKPVSTIFRVKKEGGAVMWVEGSMTNLLHDEAVKALVINYRDITHRKEAEELILKSEAKVRTILDNTSVAYILTDPDLRVVSFNLCASEQYYKELGVNLCEGVPLTSYTVPGFQDSLDDYFDRVLHGEKVSFEYSSPGNGDSSWYNVSISPVYDKQKNILGVMLASEDISLRKQRELERGRLTRDIIRHNRDLEQFAYIVSHNLRSPVANILGLSNILQEREKLSAADFDKCLMGLTLSVSKLDDVIRDLNLILQSRQAINEKKETIYFAEVLDSIRTSINDLIEKDNVKIKTELNVESIFSIKGFLHSILFNLISNSIKYRHPGRELVIEISTDMIDSKLLVKVRDNGLGFDLKLNKEKVFGLYKKFHSHIEGKGMGLYMVKTQVESLGGRISVNSEVDKGTEFIIRFDV